MINLESISMLQICVDGLLTLSSQMEQALGTRAPEDEVGDPCPDSVMSRDMTDTIDFLVSDLTEFMEYQERNAPVMQGTGHDGGSAIAG